MPSVASEPSAVTASMRAPARPHSTLSTEPKGAASPFASLLDATSPPDPPPAPPTAKPSQSSSTPPASKDARTDGPRPSDPSSTPTTDRSSPDQAPTDDSAVVAEEAANIPDPSAAGDGTAQKPGTDSGKTDADPGKKADDDAAALAAQSATAAPTPPAVPMLAIVVTPASTDAPPVSPAAVEAAAAAGAAPGPSVTPAVPSPALVTADGEPDDISTDGEAPTVDAAAAQKKAVAPQTVEQADASAETDASTAADPTSVAPGTQPQKSNEPVLPGTAAARSGQKAQAANSDGKSAAPSATPADAAPAATPDPALAKASTGEHAEETSEDGHGPAHVGSNEAVKHAAQQTLTTGHTESAAAPGNAPSNVPLLHAHDAVQTPAPTSIQSAAPQSAVSAGNPAPDPSAMAGLAAVPVSGLAVDIAARFQAGRNRFEIRLDPPDLGRVDVRLDVDRDGKVSSRLVVDKQETLDLLRRDAPQLERALQQAGFKTGDGGMQFSLRDQSFSGQNQGRNDTPADTSRIVLPDEDLTPVEAVRGYGRLLGGTAGVDIRV